ncbi:transmembrane prolyl 4-hydroxylase-like, partial [Dendronephthya gigantea]|uniref:transmembrane prolyl 4-hydroxylase-like n=1 Tax=Dendronephthya gigantea TaxID=151771 RepID=UPI00106A70B0
MMKYLPRIDPVKVGYKRNVQIFPGETHQMQTLSLNPPIFEVENFLTNEECDLIISTAKTSGLSESTTVRANRNRLSIEKIMEFFGKVDINFDRILNTYEIGEFFIKLSGLVLGDDDIAQMLNSLKLDVNHDGKLSDEEMFTGLAGKSYDKFYTYLENLQRTNPERKVRYSDTVFIEPSTSLELFENIRHRIVNLTDLPYGMIKAGEHLQVVRYRPSGHYHSHLDSENSRDSKECCQYRDWKSGCKLC